MAREDEHPLAQAAGGIAGAAVGAAESITDLVKHGAPIPPPDAPIQHEDTQFEHTDWNMRWVFISGVALLLALWMITALLTLYFNYLAQNRASSFRPPLPAVAEGKTAPPYPELQQSPPLDLQGMFRAQHAEQERYHWLDRNKGTVAIPIDRAMQIVAQKGIPPQKAPPALQLSDPRQGTLLTGFEGKVVPEEK